MKVPGHSAIASIALAIGLVAAQLGCQFKPPIQTLPTGGWSQNDGIEYFDPSPEFKKQREAAAMKAYKSDLEAQQVEQRGP